MTKLIRKSTVDRLIRHLRPIANVERELRLIRNNSGHQLTRQHVRIAKEYSYDVFKSPRYYPWLCVYTAFRGGFIEGWIPYNFYIERVLPKANTSYRLIGKAKTLTRTLLQSDALPDKAYHINGIWTDVHGNPLPRSDVYQALFNDSDSVYIKLEQGSGGDSVIKLTRSQFDEALLSTLGNFVVQKPIQQADWMARIYPGCVATLRILTGAPYGQDPQFQAAYLRVGTGTADIITSATSLRIPVDGATGQLSTFACDSKWNTHTKHPDTGFVFEGAPVHGFEGAVETCTRLHRRVRNFTMIGWDVSFNQEGEVEIMEWNTGQPDIKFAEALIGPCFRGLHLEGFA